jgi:hypothetical protein
LRVRDDVVQGNAFDGFAHQFPDAFGQRAVENQIGTALAVKPLAVERGPFFKVRGSVPLSTLNFNPSWETHAKRHHQRGQVSNVGCGGSQIRGRERRLFCQHLSHALGSRRVTVGTWSMNSTSSTTGCTAIEPVLNEPVLLCRPRQCLSLRLRGKSRRRYLRENTGITRFCQLILRRL